MRLPFAFLAATGGLALTVLSVPHAEAMTTAAPAGLRAIEGVNQAEPVDCRRYRHMHRKGGWHFGCKRKAVVYRRY